MGLTYKCKPSLNVIKCNFAQKADRLSRLSSLVSKAMSHTSASTSEKALRARRSVHTKGSTPTRRSAEQCQRRASRTVSRSALSPVSAARTLACPVLPSPSARVRHYLKHTLVFICGADDVATSSTFPSPAVYIREPIWRYKTRQQEGGGPEPERREPWKPFYRAAGCWLT